MMPSFKIYIFLLNNYVGDLQLVMLLNIRVFFNDLVLWYKDKLPNVLKCYLSPLDNELIS